MRRVVVLPFVLTLLGGCGGQIVGGDGGTAGPDGSTGGPDAPMMQDVSVTPTCSTASGSVTVGTDTCQEQAAWGCGATQYMVDCSCGPSLTGTCSCAEQTGSMGAGTMVSASSVCPSCNATPAMLATLCGFPH